MFLNVIRGVVECLHYFLFIDYLVYITVTNFYIIQILEFKSKSREFIMDNIDLFTDQPEHFGHFRAC